MARSRFSLIIAAACSLILAVPRIVVDAVERAVAFVVSLMPASADTFDFGYGPSSREVAYAGDVGVDPFVSNSLRHEAGMRRLT